MIRYEIKCLYFKNRYGVGDKRQVKSIKPSQ